VKWDVGAICAALALTGAAFGLYTRLLLDAFQARLFVEMDKRYAGSEVCRERHENLAQRVSRLENKREMNEAESFRK